MKEQNFVQNNANTSNNMNVLDFKNFLLLVMDAITKTVANPL